MAGILLLDDGRLTAHVDRLDVVAREAAQRVGSLTGTRQAQVALGSRTNIRARTYLIYNCRDQPQLSSLAEGCFVRRCHAAMMHRFP